MSESPHPPGAACGACPVCLALRVLDDVDPQVTEHLLAAGRELALALQAVLRHVGAPDGARGDGAPAGRTATSPPTPPPGTSTSRRTDGTARGLRRIDIR